MSVAAGRPRGFDLQGHRGARGLWPENSLPGIAGAVALGVTSVEVDVVLTADLVPVLSHDAALSRDLARGPDGAWIGRPGPEIGAMRLVELPSYDIGRLRPRSRYAARFPAQTAIDGTRIPTLREACALVRGHAVRLDIEIKTVPRAPVGGLQPERIAAAVLQTVEASGCQASFRSFDWRVLRALRRLCAEAPLAWLTGAGPGTQMEAVAAAVARDGWPPWQPVWAPDHHGLRRHHVAQAAAAGLQVKPWTVNAGSRIRRLLIWGVNGLCTDRPDIARAILAEQGHGF
jgi:glycerophosphoryl diester phosphodiesterase